MDWESVLDHVERMRQLDLSSEEKEDSKERKEAAKERKENEKKKKLVHTDSTETQSTRLSENDENNTEPFTVMDTVREEEEENAKRRRRESSMLSESTVRWKLICYLLAD